MYETLALLAGFVLLYSTIAGAVERSWLSGPIVFSIFGLLIGPMFLDVVPIQTERETFKLLAELALALVLFTDAADVDMKALRRGAGLPLRLLFISLPLTIALGFGLGLLLNVRLSVFELALLATMLAPTDAALGKAVMTHPAVPNNVRQGLNVESGLNDGICLPILYVFLALALNVGPQPEPFTLAVGLVGKAIGIGLVVGIALTTVALWLLQTAVDRDWLTPTWKQLPVVALALTCFTTAELLGGSGFIAAFAGGLLFRARTKRDREELLRAAEGTGDTLALLTWIAFGATVIGQAVGHFSWRTAVFAILSLTLIRMVPTFFSLTGSGLNTESKLFIGWFGPRGLASIVFAIIVLEAELPNSGTLASVVACTVGLSILAHGLTANRWARAYGARIARSQGHEA